MSSKIKARTWLMEQFEAMDNGSLPDELANKFLNFAKENQHRTFFRQCFLKYDVGQIRKVSKELYNDKARHHTDSELFKD